MAKLRGLLVGLGRRSLDDHIAALAAPNSGIDFVAACDENPNTERDLRVALESFPSVPPPEFFIDLSDALDAVDPDIAIVATPHHTHLEVAEHLLARNVAFLKEKPFAMSLPEARHLAQLIEQHSGHMRLCVQRRQHPLYVYGKRILPSLGQLRHFSASYQLNAAAYREGWRSQRETAGGGAIIDMGYHLIDVLHWYFGVPSSVYVTVAPRMAAGACGIEETVLANLTYSNGLVGSLFLSLCETHKYERLSISGSDGHIVLGRRSIEHFDRNDNIIGRLAHDPATHSGVSEVLRDMISGLSTPGIAWAEVKRGLEVTAIIHAMYRSIGTRLPISPSRIWRDQHRSAAVVAQPVLEVIDG